jgi:small-conductance mechanosensitive channel
VSILASWQVWCWSLAYAAGALVAALVIHFLLFGILTRLSRRTKTGLDESLARHFREPARWIAVFIALRLVMPLLSIPAGPAELSKHIFGLALIILVSWMLIKSTYVLSDFVVRRFAVDVKDNLRARKIHTQLNVLRRIVIFIVVVVAFATMLMTFEKVRQLGVSILASAGIAGLVVGLAAQKTIGTFIAGLQIAFTQPIRIDDVVIVENEWGRIEEITLTYVVVKIWDLRRLVVPITYFIEKPFQNWTRTSADLLGSVFLYVDYTVPVDAVREQLQKVLKESEYWDGKVCVLQVTNASERTVELRALMTAVDAPTAWNLRCEVREKLIAFIQQHYPDALPRLRAELERPADLVRQKTRPGTGDR